MAGKFCDMPPSSASAVRPSRTARSPDLPERRDLPWWGWLGAAVVLYGLSLAGFSLSAIGEVVAPWWPAAGASLLLALLTPPRRLPLALTIVLAVTLAANLTVGRALWLSAGLAFANAIEIAVVALILGIQRRRFALASVRHAGRLILASAAGASLLGAIAGMMSWLTTSHTFLEAGATAAASHMAAMLLIAPFGALPPRTPDSTGAAIGAFEAIAQSVTLAAAVVFAFRPAASLPVSFIVFTFIAWGALRQPIIVAYLQALIVAVVAFSFERAVLRSFAGYEMTPELAALATVVFMCTIAIFTLLLVTARYEAVTAMTARLDLAQAQVAAERERSAALSERLELERQREDFVATTSHELRTPVTSIAGYAELLADADLPPRERAWVEVIERNTLRLTKLVEDLLILGRTGAHADASGARVSAPAEATAPAPAGTATGALVADVLATLHPAARARDIDVQADIAELTLRVDRIAARRVMLSLVGNAVKFTPPGGVVDIRVERDGDDAVVNVTDTGTGMSDETRAHAFERFYRGEDAERLNTPGIGVGLSIVRELVEGAGGRVWLENTPTGGLRAGCTLPLE